MENKSGAFRKKRIYFSQVSNSALRDANLSLKAKGLYALIQSFISVENFTLYKSTLRKQCSEGEKAFENAWKELKDKGYLIQYRLKGDNGCFYYEYDLLDEAESIHTPEKEGMDKEVEIHTPKMVGVDNIPCGKGGLYNNTKLNNTDLNNTNTSTSKNDNIELVKNFQENICELKKTTRAKFLNYCNAYSTDLIMAILEYSRENNIKSFKGFQTIIESAISKNIITGKNFIESVGTYGLSKKEEQANSYSGKKLRFHNFEARQYDYDSLERKLLGWD